MRGKFLKICWPAVSPVRGCQVTCRGWGEIINTGSPGSTPAVVNRQQSSQHPSRQDADSQDDQTCLQNDQEQAPAAQEGCHQDDHHRGGAWQHRQRGPRGGTPLQIKRIKKNVQKMHGLFEQPMQKQAPAEKKKELGWRRRTENILLLDIM